MRILTLFLTTLLIGILPVSCSQSSRENQLNEWIKPNGKVKVLSTTAMIDDIVGEVGGDEVDHIPLIKGEIDPHHYELVKGDGEKLGRADIILFNGLGLEHGASLSYSLANNPNAIGLGNLIRKKFPELILEESGQIDPHIWMDLSIWVQTIDPIVEILSLKRPEKKVLFEENGKKLKDQILAKDKEITLLLKSINPNKRYLVTSHDAFNYFTKKYLRNNDELDWKIRCRAPEGLAPDGQLSCTDIQNLIDHLCHYKINVVFSESNISKDSLRKIVSVCLEKGHYVKICSEPLYADALGNKESGAGTYLKMIQHNVDTITHAWK